MDLGGFRIPDDQARTAVLVGIGALVALLALLLARRTRRLVLGLVVTALLAVGYAYAARAGLVPDPLGLAARLPA